MSLARAILPFVIDRCYIESKLQGSSGKFN